MQQLLAKVPVTTRLNSRARDGSVITVLAMIFNHSLALCFSSPGYGNPKALPQHTLCSAQVQKHDLKRPNFNLVL